MLMIMIGFIFSIPFLFIGTTYIVRSINEMAFYPLSLLFLLFPLLNILASYLDNYLEKKWGAE